MVKSFINSRLEIFLDSTLEHDHCIVKITGTHKGPGGFMHRFYFVWLGGQASISEPGQAQYQEFFHISV